MAFSADRTLILLDGEAKQLYYHTFGKNLSVQKNIIGAKLVVSNNGDIYTSAPGKIWLIRGKKPLVVDEGLKFASAITISPDKSLLFVAEDNTNRIYSFVINNDGTLKDKESFYWLHQSGDDSYTKVTDLAVDNHGNLYAATNLGVQVCDQNGRVRAILQLPGGAITGLCFGGDNFDSLYVICGGKLYKRKLKVNGVPAWAPVVHPPGIGAG
jgi:sugar lactone lactonase YvrE